MSLVYNNDKPIGKCESYSIDKIPGTTPFVMLTNYEPLRSELNENQQVVLEWLKEEKEERCSFESAIYWYFEDDVEPDIISDRLTQIEFLQVLAAFAEWGMKEVAE
ncbi:hypothetical protein ACR77M_00420 [Enterococcus avium]|uniref:hypothetical protein n=1 Tax=Enterococcus avium TaxID=33945 RepID=UPI003DA36ED7